MSICSLAFILNDTILELRTSESSVIEEHPSGDVILPPLGGESSPLLPSVGDSPVMVKPFNIPQVVPPIDGGLCPGGCIDEAPGGDGKKLENGPPGCGRKFGVFPEPVECDGGGMGGPRGGAEEIASHGSAGREALRPVQGFL